MGDPLPLDRKTIPRAAVPEGKRFAPSLLQTRAAFLAHWDWALVEKLDLGACEGAYTRQSFNPESYDRVRQGWEAARLRESSFIDVLRFLHECHDDAPFLFFNGATFAAITRRLTETLLAGQPVVRQQAAVAIVVQFVEGTLAWEAFRRAWDCLTETARFNAGDRVRTLCGSVHGVVLRVLPDGRVVWRPANTGSLLVASPEGLLREEDPEDPKSACTGAGCE